MKPVTREMVKMYELRKLGFDFMGYNIHNINDVSFHHLIVPKRDCKSRGFGDGYYLWNGAILVQDTSHDYLHAIESVDREMFGAITQIMIQQNLNGNLILESLKEKLEIFLSYLRGSMTEIQSERERKEINKNHLIYKIV